MNIISTLNFAFSKVFFCEKHHLGFICFCTFLSASELGLVPHRDLKDFFKTWSWKR